MVERRNGGWRTWLALARVSNLPTVWSNCLAGWLLGGGGRWSDGLAILGGASLLYTGGMLLNDAFDADFDRQHRPERPIPSGRVAPGQVWWWGFLMMGAGVALLAVPGRETALVAVLLSLAILVYDAVHKIIAFSPVLMAVCRTLLVLLAATPTDQGPVGIVVWSALVLGSYVAGLSFLARHESGAGAVHPWPCVLLAAPLVLALVVNRGAWLAGGVSMTVLVSFWILLCLRHAFWAPQRHVGRSVAGLLAGIVLVDWLALGGASFGLNLAFAGLFGLTWLLQRFVPAT